MTEQLRPFQEEDFLYFKTHPKSGIWYEPRLGKTVITTKLAVDETPASILIVCPKNAVYIWYDHLLRWFKQEKPDHPLKIVLINAGRTNNAGTRHMRWCEPRLVGGTTVYIVVWGSALRDYAGLLKGGHTWEMQVYDEYHDYLLGRKTKSFEMVQQLAWQPWVKRFHLLSGTPVDRGPQHFWTALHLFNKRYFGSYWKFVGAFCVVEKNPWGGMTILDAKNMENFHKTMTLYGRIRFRKDVMPQMPRIIRDLKHVNMTADQEKHYSELKVDNFTWTGEEMLIASNSLEQHTRLRQLLVCPKILDESLSIGGAMEDLITTLREAPSDQDRHTVIFTTFSGAIPHFIQALRDEGFVNVYALHGGLSAEDVRDRVAWFKAGRGIIVCTTAYAQAFDLSTAQVCYHIGYEYRPTKNKQAEERLVPQVGDYSIMSWYYSYVDTIDDNIAGIVNIKQQLVNVTMGAR